MTIREIVADVINGGAIRVWKTPTGVEVVARVSQDSKWSDPADWAWVIWRRVTDAEGSVPQPVVDRSRQRVAIGDRVIIHWILPADEVAVADALQSLPPDAPLRAVQAVFTLPQSDGEWVETIDDNWRYWTAPGSGYAVARPRVGDFGPCLRLPTSGGWVWPTLTALHPLAVMLGYAGASSLRVAISQGRLRSRKQGRVHLVHRDDLLKALADGKLRPRQ